MSCSKDDSITNPKPSTGSVTMKVDGLNWSGDELANMIDEASQVAVISVLSNAKNENLGITIDKFTGSGSYNSANLGEFTLVTFANKNKVIFYGGPDDISINVTSITGSGVTKKFHGTFSCTLKSNSGTSVIITEGNF